MNSLRLPAAILFIRTAKNGLVVPLDPCFRLDLDLHPSGDPSGELTPSPASRGTLGESGENDCAGKAEGSSRASGGPDLSASEDGRRSSSSSHRLPRAVKTRRRRTRGEAS
jgi:hypothetical protein